MSKQHTTIKNIKSTWSNVWRCGYCDLQYIMKYEEPMYYNSGVYGWNCDVYCDFKNDVAITTGYRNMAGRVIPHELIERYSKVAKNIMADAVAASYSEIKNALDQNRARFFEELANI